MSVRHWTAFDVRHLLPDGWRETIGDVALQHAVVKHFPPTPGLTRESTAVGEVHRGQVEAEAVAAELPWLYDLYRTAFADLAEYIAGELVTPARDGLVLDLQSGTGMRAECRTDANPLTGILLCTDHPAGEGGETVFGLDARAVGVEAVEADCSAVPAEEGRLTLFDARLRPYYVRPLLRSDAIRIAAVMRYYTESHPEPGV